MIDAQGVIEGTGYSGQPPHTNDPESMNLKGLGPIPEGFYTIGAPYDSPRTGPYTLPLIPDASNEMYGRSEFKIHGERVEPPAGFASDGCIVQILAVRVKIWTGGDHRLQVVASLPPANLDANDL